MLRTTLLARVGGMQTAVALGALFLVAACQDGSRPVAPSLSASSSSLPHINITELPLPVSVNAALTVTRDGTCLGRCVQGSRYGFNHAEVTTGSAFAEFGISDCQNSPGPFISMDASLAYEGLGVQVIFRNNDNPVGGPHEATRSQTLSIIPPGLSFTFPKQPVQGGVGGNPWILAGFLDGGGAKVSDATLLGRCVQLSKALS